MKAQRWSGHILHARSCVRRGYPSEAMHILFYCTKSGRMSRKLGIGDIAFHRRVMSDNIDDIQDHRYRMSHRTYFNPTLKCINRYYVRGFACNWMARRARNPSPSELVTLNPRARATDLDSVRIWEGSLRATDPRARGTTHDRKIKNTEGPKNHIYI